MADKQLNISLVNKKGGVGKTMLADEVAFALERRGRSVSFVSIDPQAGARHLSGSSLGSDFVIIDTRGSLDDDMRTAISLSDVCIVPFLPSEVNIPSTLETLEFIRDVNPDAIVLVVMNRYSRTKTRTSGAFMEAVRKGGLLAGEAVFHVLDRAAFQNAEALGCSAAELDWKSCLPIEDIASALELVAAGRPMRDVLLQAAASSWCVLAGER